MGQTYEVETIEHLGLVATMIDELGIVDLIDEAIKQDLKQRKVSVGQAVKAMILCGLGFTNHRLYLAGHFFTNKPTERLIGEGIKANHIHDDLLGRALDSLYEYGLTTLFHQLSREAAEKLGVKSRVFHADSTTFHVDGEYNSEEENPDPAIIHITKGYSRDHRPDLDQFALNLIVENEAGLPISLQLASGNQSDSHGLPELIKQYINQLQGVEKKPLFVADAAWYGADNIQNSQQQGYHFLSRVPQHLNLAKATLAETSIAQMTPLKEGYKATLHRKTYGKVEQQWVVIHSQEAKERAQKTVSRQWRKKSDTDCKRWQKLTRQTFNCQSDAQQAVEQFQKKAHCCDLSNWRILAQAHYAQVGRPKSGTTPDKVTYFVEGELYIPLASYQQTLDRKALFILATSELDEMSPLQILDTYQGQTKVERGFRFLKDPLFLINTIFLKKEERVMAMMMVMTLCLLVYAALEHRIRLTLKEHHYTVPNQKSQPTQIPTTRWVFQAFLDVVLLTILTPSSTPQVVCMNLRPEFEQLLSLLGDAYTSIYSLPPP